jgi:hypothetical protein
VSVHSNHYDTDEEYERDLRAEYNRPEYHEDDPDYQKRKKKVNYGCPTEDYLERGDANES